MIERPRFSRDIRREVGLALISYMNNPTPAAEDRVSAAIGRVCAEARAQDLAAHDLVRGLTQLYVELPGVDDEPRRVYYRYFVQSCVKALQINASTAESAT